MTEYKVIFNSQILQEIRVHARSSMNEEICGVLIGKKDDKSTVVTARIAGKGAAQAGANVTFTQEAWENIYKVKDVEYPEESIVGWYHSHPGFGIFLSEYDLFIHNNFFNAKHQLAWVYDPHSDDEGCFGWIGDEVKPISEITVVQKERRVGVVDDKVTANHKVQDISTSQDIIKPELIPKHKVILRVIIALLFIIDCFLIYNKRETLIPLAKNEADYISATCTNVLNKIINW
jgi:proteasome lid subunit RPN8/RPN11